MMKRVSHNSMCPLRKADLEAKDKAAKEHLEQVNTLLIGTSQLRLIDQEGTTAKILASSGARIGHTANTLRYETTENYELIAIQTGDNNYDPNIDISTFSNASQTDREQHDETQNLTT